MEGKHTSGTLKPDSCGAQGKEEGGAKPQVGSPTPDQLCLLALRTSQAHSSPPAQASLWPLAPPAAAGGAGGGGAARGGAGPLAPPPSGGQARPQRRPSWPPPPPGLPPASEGRPPHPAEAEGRIDGARQRAVWRWGWAWFDRVQPQPGAGPFEREEAHPGPSVQNAVGWQRAQKAGAAKRRQQYPCRRCMASNQPNTNSGQASCTCMSPISAWMDCSSLCRCCTCNRE